MKKTILTIAVAIACSTAVFTSQAGTFVPNQTNAALGDLMLGFETTGGGGSKNLVIDLGSVTNTTALNSLNVNLYSDLTNVFGVNYTNTVSYALYSVSSTKTIWASAVATSNNTSGYPVSSASSQGSQKIAFGNLLSTYNNDGNPTAPNQTTPNGVYELVSETYSWGSFTPSSQAFGSADYPNIDVPIGTTAALYEMIPSTGGGNGIYYNVSLNVSSAGALTAAAVPEPRTNAFLVIGMMALGYMTYKRRLKNQKA